MSLRRIALVANKSWEVAPLLSVLNNRDARPTSVVPDGCRVPGARATLRCNDVAVHVWCVQDLMNPDEHESRSWEKANVLPCVSRSSNPDLVIAFGSAANPNETEDNGSVVIGRTVFVHDPYGKPPRNEPPPDATKHWKDGPLDTVLDSPQVLPRASSVFYRETAKRLLRAPNAGAVSPQITIAPNAVSVGVVNVVTPIHYKWADRQALDRFASVAPHSVAACLETTHGLIRILLKTPFIYVSGFANTVGRYDEEVVPNKYLQNFVAGHNAAVAITWLLPEIVEEGVV